MATTHLPWRVLMTSGLPVALWQLRQRQRWDERRSVCFSEGSKLVMFTVHPFGPRDFSGSLRAFFFLPAADQGKFFGSYAASTGSRRPFLSSALQASTSLFRKTRRLAVVIIAGRRPLLARLSTVHSLTPRSRATNERVMRISSVIILCRFATSCS